MGGNSERPGGTTVGARRDERLFVFVSSTRDDVAKLAADALRGFLTAKIGCDVRQGTIGRDGTEAHLAKLRARRAKAPIFMIGHDALESDDALLHQIPRGADPAGAADAINDAVARVPSTVGGRSTKEIGEMRDMLAQVVLFVRTSEFREILRPSMRAAAGPGCSASSAPSSATAQGPSSSKGTTFVATLASSGSAGRTVTEESTERAAMLRGAMGVAAPAGGAGGARARGPADHPHPGGAREKTRGLASGPAGHALSTGLRDAAPRGDGLSPTLLHSMLGKLVEVVGGAAKSPGTTINITVNGNNNTISTGAGAATASPTNTTTTTTTSSTSSTASVPRRGAGAAGHAGEHADTNSARPNPALPTSTISQAEASSGPRRDERFIDWGDYGRRDGAADALFNGKVPTPRMREMHERMERSYLDHRILSLQLKPAPWGTDRDAPLRAVEVDGFLPMYGSARDNQCQQYAIAVSVFNNHHYAGMLTKARDEAMARIVEFVGLHAERGATLDEMFSSGESGDRAAIFECIQDDFAYVQGRETPMSGVGHLAVLSVLLRLRFRVVSPNQAVSGSNRRSTPDNPSGLYTVAWCEPQYTTGSPGASELVKADGCVTIFRDGHHFTPLRHQRARVSQLLAADGSLGPSPLYGAEGLRKLMCMSGAQLYSVMKANIDAFMQELEARVADKAARAAAAAARSRSRNTSADIDVEGSTLELTHTGDTTGAVGGGSPRAGSQSQQPGGGGSDPGASDPGVDDGSHSTSPAFSSRTTSSTVSPISSPPAQQPLRVLPGAGQPPQTSGAGTPAAGVQSAAAPGQQGVRSSDAAQQAGGNLPRPGQMPNAGHVATNLASPGAPGLQGCRPPGAAQQAGGNTLRSAQTPAAGSSAADVRSPLAGGGAPAPHGAAGSHPIVQGRRSNNPYVRGEDGFRTVISPGRNAHATSDTAAPSTDAAASGAKMTTPCPAPKKRAAGGQSNAPDAQTAGKRSTRNNSGGAY
jgi:hypothetical protein